MSEFLAGVGVAALVLVVAYLAYLVYRAGRAVLKAVRKPVSIKAERAFDRADKALDWAKRINPRQDYGSGLYSFNDYPVRAASEDSVEELARRVEALEARIYNDKKQPGKKESK